MGVLALPVAGTMELATAVFVWSKDARYPAFANVEGEGGFELVGDVLAGL